MINVNRTSTELHLVAPLGGRDELIDSLRALLLQPFIDGTQPWATTVRVNRVRDNATLLPPGSTPDRIVTNRSGTAMLITGPDWSLLVSRGRGGFARLVVTAADEDLGRSIIDSALAEATEPESPEQEAAVTRISFWHATQWGGRRTERSISVCRWEDIRRNYGRRVGVALSRLSGTDLEQASGRLVLLHGPPGTGKTTALRALAHAWRKQCRFEYVLDPERVLGDSGYLMSVVYGEDDYGSPAAIPEAEGAGPPKRRWRLLILEDCDELIRTDAKRSTGQALARLLNLTDGILGQGLDLLVAITTNEPLAQLHPGVTRPGRCLAQVEVGRLTPAEARAWLGPAAGVSAVGPAGATLAELFAIRGELGIIQEVTPDVAIGSYL